MKTHAVLSVLGRDRIGIADDLGALLDRRKIDIEDSRMTALQGRFALIAHVSGRRAELSGLESDLASLRADLRFHLQVGAAEPKPAPERRPQFLIESFSSGPSGMSALTGILKRHDINIEDLKTEASAAPWTSGMTFHMTACITVPPSCSVARLREELHELERKRDLDVVLKPKPFIASADGPFPTTEI